MLIHSSVLFVMLTDEWISSFLSKKDTNRYPLSFLRKKWRDTISSLTNCICLCDTSHCNVILCV
uniref:Uncharacterized protein n=1 Tax=Anguilla anguilla TaxID=7936 RepID=A0A0E9WVP5_ANGAN